MTRRFYLLAGVAVLLALVSALGVLSGGSSAQVPPGPVELSSSRQSQRPAVAEGTNRIVTAIAAEFGVSEDEVTQLHKEGIGFGALFKVYQLARLTGVSAPSIVATFPRVNGELQPGFGDRFAVLTDVQKAELKKGPRNLGSMVSDHAKKKR